jgi:hypothetical protein
MEATGSRNGTWIEVRPSRTFPIGLWNQSRRYASTMSLDTELFSTRPLSLEDLGQGLPGHTR